MDWTPLIRFIVNQSHKIKIPRNNTFIQNLQTITDIQMLIIQQNIKFEKLFLKLI